MPLPASSPSSTVASVLGAALHLLLDAMGALSSTASAGDEGGSSYAASGGGEEGSSGGSGKVGGGGSSSSQLLLDLRVDYRVVLRSVCVALGAALLAVNILRWVRSGWGCAPAQCCQCLW